MCCRKEPLDFHIASSIRFPIAPDWQVACTVRSLMLLAPASKSSQGGLELLVTKACGPLLAGAVHNWEGQ